MELADTATPVMAEPLGRGQHVGDVRGRPGPSSQVMGAGAVAALVPGDVIDDHIMRPNAQTMQEIVRRVNGDRNGAAETCSNALCCLVGCCGCATLCCGRLFRTGVGEIDLWLDSSKRPLALEPNQWQWRPNLFQESLGRYNMADEEVFSNAGVALAKIESGSVYFAHQGGQPVMIAGLDKAGWFVTTEPGFSFAKKVLVEDRVEYGCRAKLSSSYINFQSLHLFNVQPNTVHIVSKFTPGLGNQWQVLPPGSHSFSSPYMKSTAVIPTSIQDVIITEDRVSTQDGIGLSNCKAVLSYQIRLENVSKLLDLDVSKYRMVIEDWAKRTMLHEIGNTDYQSHTPMTVGEGGSASGESTSPFPSGTSVLGGKGGLPGMSSGRPVAGSAEEESNFRPQLEYHMRKSLEKSLTPYGVSVLTFALQSFDPPASLANQVTAALARRTEAQYAFQAAQIGNQTILAAAETEATAIRTRAAAVAKAAQLTAACAGARQLQILDKQVEIAKAWSQGNVRTLILQGGGSAGAAGGAGGAFPFASISELQRDEAQSGQVAPSR